MDKEFENVKGSKEEYEEADVELTFNVEVWMPFRTDDPRVDKMEEDIVNALLKIGEELKVAAGIGIEFIGSDTKFGLTPMAKHLMDGDVIMEKIIGKDE